ncbi:hypothetical protein [Sediminispirochaeta bajacaliforniensis]|uniref:hypothetical protein n=1 Tax=Sediminispirochaeta bajacaliforniensis TaxID=148 RepID=UPI001FE01173|nr:hypothetical protein [Sediminispirochaeta bajacaliforniensis]
MGGLQMGAPIYNERVKENGEAYTFQIFRDAAGIRVIVFDACGEALASSVLAEANDEKIKTAARDFCENYAIDREDRMNYRGIAC